MTTSPSRVQRDPICTRPRTLPTTVSRQMDMTRIRQHLEVFQDIANNYGGNRAGGTEGYEQAAQYVETTMRNAGYETRRQVFDFTYEEIRTTSLYVNGLPVEYHPIRYSPSTTRAGVNGTLAVPHDEHGCAPTSWKGIDLAGKIALLRRGQCGFADKARAAAQRGAVAVIVYNDTDGDLNGTLGRYIPELIPIVGVTAEVGECLTRLAETGPTVANLILSKVIEQRKTFNILAEIPGRGDINEVVMAGAHLDSVQEGPGINDDATGIATLLEVARHLPQLNVTNHVRFAFFGAEEYGVLGARHYVTDLAENSPEDLDRIAVYLDFEMLGSPNFQIGVFDTDQTTFPTPFAVPEGSVQLKHVITEYLDSIQQPWVDIEFWGSCNYEAFIPAGIPIGGLFTGADYIKSEDDRERFGGVSGEPYDPNFHRKGDVLSNINYTPLEICARAAAHLIVDLAQSTEIISHPRRVESQ